MIIEVKFRNSWANKNGTYSAKSLSNLANGAIDSVEEIRYGSEEQQMINSLSKSYSGEYASKIAWKIVNFVRNNNIFLESDVVQLADMRQGKSVDLYNAVGAMRNRTLGFSLLERLDKEAAAFRIDGKVTTKDKFMSEASKRLVEGRTKTVDYYD